MRKKTHYTALLLLEKYGRVRKMEKEEEEEATVFFFLFLWMDITRHLQLRLISFLITLSFFYEASSF